VVTDRTGIRAVEFQLDDSQGNTHTLDRYRGGGCSSCSTESLLAAVRAGS
jgi:hypothetical protein